MGNHHIKCFKNCNFSNKTIEETTQGLAIVKIFSEVTRLREDPAKKWAWKVP